MPDTPLGLRPLPELDDELRADWIRRNTIAERNAQALGRKWPRYGSPATLEAEDAMAATPANTAGLKLVPVIGPGMDLYNDLRHNRGWDAVKDAGLGVVDALLAASGAGLLELGAKGALEGAVTRPASFTAEEVAARFRRLGATKPGQQLHHTDPLRGFPRDQPSLKNNPLLMKPLDLAKHRRIHGGWDGAKRYDPIRRVWIGTQDWMKAVPAWLAAHGLDMATSPAQQPSASPPSLLPNPDDRKPAQPSTAKW